MRPIAWWRGLEEQNRRETDERARTTGLLVVRDGFIAVMLLIGVLVLFQTIFRIDGVDARSIMAFFPMVAIFVAGGVMGISAVSRGGYGWSSGAATYQSAFMLLGALVGAGLLSALSLLGVGPSLSEMWWSLVGTVSGFVIGVIIWILMSRRNQ